MRKHFVVVGGGPGGATFAVTVAEAGHEVTLFEKGQIGGHAVWNSLLPSKVQLRAAQLARGNRLFNLTWPRVYEGPGRVAAVSSQAADDIRQRLARAKVTVIQADVRTVQKGAVRWQEGDTLRELAADGVVIATGSAQRIPSGVHPDGRFVLIPRDVARLRDLPGAVVVAGAGPTGVELASLFASLGTRVTLLTRATGILKTEDADVAAVVTAVLTGEGIEIVTGEGVQTAEVSEAGVRVVSTQGRTISADQLMLATGRMPAHLSLGLLQAGVQLDQSGWILVDGFSQTAVSDLFAVGDATGEPLVANKATLQAMTAAKRAVGEAVAPLRLDRLPIAIYSDPEVARVGLREVDLRRAGRSFLVYRSEHVANWHALLQGSHSVFVKALVDPGDGRLLGAAAVGAGAAGVIDVAATAMGTRATIDDLRQLPVSIPGAAAALWELRPAGD